MSTTLVFHGQEGESNAQITLPDTAQFKIVGGAMSLGGPVLAAFHEGEWCLGTARFERITCDGLVLVEFHGREGARSFGPFCALTIMKDEVSTAAGVLARYHPFDEVWCFEQQCEAETVVVREHVLSAAA